MEKHSIQRYAMDHDAHDDEMRGIREITNDYTPEPAAGQRIKVIFLELQAFEQELQTHARIEDEILFPKALLLESEIKQMLGKATKLN
jgi:regulator of cell morphogenesis and NO signaling